MTWMDRLMEWFRPSGVSGGGAFDNALADARRARCGGDAETALGHAERARGLAVYGEQTNDAEFERARALTALKRFDEAQPIFEWMQRDAAGIRTKAQANIGLGELATARGDLNEARVQFENAVNMTRGANPLGFGDVAALARGFLAEAALRDGGARYADHLLREGLTMLPPDADRGLRGWLTGLLGEAALENGQAAQAMGLLEQAMALSGAAGCRVDGRRWAARIGERALAEGRIEDAHAAFFRVLSLYPTNTLTPDYADAVLGMSRADLESRDGKQAEEALAYAEIGLRTAEALNDARRTARAHGAVGEALKALGRSGDALPHLRAALEGNVDAPLSARRALAGALFEAGDHAEALKTYEDAIVRADHSGRALERANLRRDLGLAHWKLNEPTRAIPVWTSAISLYEEANALAQAARLYVDIANARRSVGMRTRAVKDIEQALMLLNMLDKEDVETRGLVLSNAAVIYAESADAESADAFFKEAVELAAAGAANEGVFYDATAHTTRLGNYGWFLLLVGRPRRAQTTLEQALAISREYGLKLQEAVQTDNLGLVYEALGEYPHALELHERALTMIDEPDWRARFRVGIANTLVALGRHDEAFAHLDAAQESAREGGQNETLSMALTARARACIAAGRLDEAAVAAEEAISAARKIDQRRVLAEALAERSRLEARLGQHEAAAATWAEAQKLYLLLHMPQGKITPEWI